MNKGSSEIPDYRSRYVGKEFKRGQAGTSDLYAAAPALEALKLLVSDCATEQGSETHLMLSDVKRAYFHAPAVRELYVELPDEDPGKAQGLVGKLNLSLYGTRDAAANWQKCVAEHLVGIGFQQGLSNPCVFHHKARNVRTLVHGDDYASTGDIKNLKWLQTELEARFNMKTQVVGTLVRRASWRRQGS